MLMHETEPHFTVLVTVHRYTFQSLMKVLKEDSGRFESSDVKIGVNLIGQMKKTNKQTKHFLWFICTDLYSTFSFTQFTVIFLSFCGNPIDKNLSLSPDSSPRKALLCMFGSMD